MIKKSSATIKDISKRLGISTSTVSRALNGHQDVSPKTKEAVLELASALDYQPNAIAQSLKNQRTNIIGVVIPETVNYFFSRAIAGIQEVATAAHMNVMVCQSNESHVVEANNVRTLLNAQVDGLIASISKETADFQHFQSLQTKKMPLVFFDRIAAGLGVSSVQSDDYDAAFKATEHLIDIGCRRIAKVRGHSHLLNYQWRMKGYRDALDAAGIPYREELVLQRHYDPTEVEAYTQALLDDHQPDGIFATKDEEAMRMMRVIRGRGLRVPEDIAVIGFNNSVYAEYIEPPLTSVEIPAFDMGKVAAELFMETLSQEDFIPQQRILPSKLIIRQSTRR